MESLGRDIRTKNYTSRDYWEKGAKKRHSFPNLGLMIEEKQNSSYDLYRAILMSLCVNFNENYIPTEEWKCDMRSDHYFHLRALTGQTLKITTLQKLPLSGVVQDENGKLRGNGIAFDIFHEVQKKAGFQYEIKLPEKNFIGSGEEGLLKLLQNKEVDMAVTFLPVMTVVEDVIEYSTALSEFEWVLFMARPAASASNSGLLAPFQVEVWMCILISLIIAGPTMYLIAHYRNKLQNKNPNAGFSHHQYKSATNNPYSLDACCWFVYGALMKQGSTMNPVYDSPRLFFATWWIFITILTSFYTANLTAFLTLSHFTLPIQTTYDIYKHHRHWMADHDGYEESLIYIEDSFDYLKETIPQYGRFTEESLPERLEKISKGEIYVAEKRKAKVLMTQDYTNKSINHVIEKKRCTYVLSPKIVLSKPMAFAYPKGSKLKDLFDPVVEAFVSAGIVTHLLNAQLPLSDICPLDLPNTERKLLNSNLATTYKLIFLGFTISLVAFIGEVIYRFCKKKTSPPTLKAEKDKYDDYESKFKNKSNVFLVKEHKANPEFDDNFPIYEYYKEIMPYGYNNKFNFGQDKYSNINKNGVGYNNFLYQYVN